MKAFGLWWREQIREGRGEEVRRRVLLALTGAELGAGMGAVALLLLAPGWIGFVVFFALIPMLTGTFGASLLASMKPWVPDDEERVATKRAVEGGLELELPNPGPIPMPLDVTMVGRQFLYSLGVLAALSVLTAVGFTVQSALTGELLLVSVIGGVFLAQYLGWIVACGLLGRAILALLMGVLQRTLWTPSITRLAVADGVLTTGFSRFSLRRPHQMSVTAHGGRATLDLVAGDEVLSLASNLDGIQTLVDTLAAMAPAEEGGEIPEELRELVGDRLRRADRGTRLEG